MSEYTPSTEEVRSQYSRYGRSVYVPEAAVAFDRWLAAHDAEVRAEADNDRDELREFVDGLGEHLSDAWDEDVALEEILQRFVQDYASLDREILAARAEDDFNGVKPIVFVWDQNEGSLVRALSHPAEAERDALAAQLEAAQDVLKKHGARGGYVIAAQEARRILDANPSSILAERDARVRAEGGKQALLDAANDVHPFDPIGGLSQVTRGGVAKWLRARAEQEHQPLERESER